MSGAFDERDFEGCILLRFPTNARAQGGVFLVDFEILEQALDLARSMGFQAAGMDGFELDEGTFRPLLDCIVDLSQLISASTPLANQYEALRSAVGHLERRPDAVELVLVDSAREVLG